MSPLMLLAQPVRIHSHNDYRQPKPLQEALAEQVFSLEADVFLYNGQIRVAHDAAELPAAPLLDSLYLQPLLRWALAIPAGETPRFPYLLIDIKENSALVLSALEKLLAQYPRLFNPEGMRVVISGERGPVSEWNAWPGYFLFDGRPDEAYDLPILTRVAFISDAYKDQGRGNRKRIRSLARSVHRQGKLLRLWGIPDTPDSWKQMKKWGVDIINTDHPGACRKFLMKGSRKG